MQKAQMTVQGVTITILEDDFISLTDIARRFDPENPITFIQNWLRNRETVEYLGNWEILHNPNFKVIEFDDLYAKSGINRFNLSLTKWIERTTAIGIRTKLGKGGGTYAHKDIAMAFCFWLSPTFQLYTVKEYQRLKSLENPEWNMRRALAKVNYNLHKGAVRQHIIPAMKGTPKAAAAIAFSEEADMFNLALFGLTAEQWRKENPDWVAQGFNIRDTADIYQLLVLANIEAYNETLIHYQLSKEERLDELQKTASRQLEALYSMNRLPLSAMQSPHLLPEKDVQNLSAEEL